MSNDAHERAVWSTQKELTELQKKLASRIVSNWGGGKLGVEPVNENGQLIGPFDLMVANPSIGQGITEMLSGFAESSLSFAEKELIIVMVAAKHKSKFMWEGHIGILERELGKTSNIRGLMSGQKPELKPDLTSFYEMCEELLESRDLGDHSFKEYEEQYGWDKILESVWLIGVYEMLAMAMRVARTKTPIKLPRRENV